MMKRYGWPSLVVITVSLLLAACGSEEKVCAPDQRLCSNTCVSLLSDARNCGACGNACGSGRGCSAGACVDCAASPGVCTAEVLSACSIQGDIGQVRPLARDLTASGPPLPTDAAPVKFANASGKLFVANSVSSSISSITLSPPASTTGAAAIAIPSAPAGFPDLEYLAAHGGYLWASNASTNTLVVVDPASGAVVDELPLPPGPFGSNPQGIDFVGAKAYLALNGIDSVAVIDVAKVPGISRTKTLDLSIAVPGQVSAMPSRVLAAGKMVYVSLWGFDPVTFAPPVGSHGRLAVIDTITDTVLAEPVDLGSGCLNPGGMALDGTILWVACGFHAYNSAEVTGGALIPVELSGVKPILHFPIVLPTNAAGSVAICNGRGYAGATESGTVLSFDPVNLKLLDTRLVCPAPAGKASYVSDVICAP